MRVWLSRITTLVLAAVCLLVLFVAYGLLDNRWYRVLAVEGGSMEPTISWGDAVVITRPPAELKPGMIITMEVGRQLVTHRVIGVNPLRTKGDANSGVDQWRPGTVRVVGQVRFWIPRLGSLLGRIRLAAVNVTGSFLHSRDAVRFRLQAAASEGCVHPPKVWFCPPRSVDEGGLFRGVGRFSDADPHDDQWTARVDYGVGTGWLTIPVHPDRTVQLRHRYLESGEYEARLRVADEHGLGGEAALTVPVRNLAPRIGHLRIRKEVRNGRLTVKVSAPFSDPGVLDTHTAIWGWGHGSSAGVVVERRGSGWVHGSHTYTKPGTYRLRLMLRDDDGGVSSVTLATLRFRRSGTASGSGHGGGGVSETTAGGTVPAHDEAEAAMPALADVTPSPVGPTTKPDVDATPMAAPSALPSPVPNAAPSPTSGPAQDVDPGPDQNTLPGDPSVAPK